MERYFFVSRGFLIAIIFSSLWLITSCKQDAKKDTSVTTPPITTPSNPTVIDPATLAVNVPVLGRNFYGAKHEPEQGILHGAGQDIDGFKDYAAAVGEGSHPIIYMTYVGLGWHDGDINWWGEELIRQLNTLPADVIPQIGLDFVVGRDNGSGQAAAVVRGDYDVQLAAVVKAIKNLGRKNFVRIGYEFEGSWNGYDAENYILAFQKIAKALRDADTNSAIVWCSAGGTAGFQPWATLSTYYPGDDYVDWFGVDVFSAEEIIDPRLITFLQKADEYKKPVMIGESTARYIGTLQGNFSWANWFKPFYTLLYQNPQIKAFCYINWDWVFWSNKEGSQLQSWGDARIEKNAIVNTGVKQELKNAIFVHSNGQM